MVFGFVTKKALTDWQNKPLYLPQFQFYERHRTVISTTTPEKILPAIADYDAQQDVIVKTLMSVRQLPQKLRRHKSESATSPFGLHSFTLLENTKTELCYGLRGQFWRTDFGLEDVPDISAYCAALQTGNAKLLMRYQVQQFAPDEYTLCTETFIYCPDRTTQLKMAGYWLAIRVGSGWIRQRILKAVKLELEKAG
ncbi:hypothetical protein ABRQ01_18355 [Pectobacterium aroidearum]|uniref:hypothetical protein n=1 Tax=Pectobacterium aroidearum TaxID=1201031 RepID=UPI0032EF0DC5